ncbi:DUF6153 family protein [Streptomyces lycii]|uniref:Uncharacterized protein n=1 Tax=Streptomyces lycii TaxID=2654337 RepID=A0ABQ7FHI2_9ACTN|nr:DUF6153 family protein [Streptomyces lycii]KAF4408285.1 hypothetical protein GCU69_15155 [Streptomyces lycii]
MSSKARFFPARQQPVRRTRALFVLTLLAGLLGMHGLAPAAALPTAHGHGSGPGHHAQQVRPAQHTGPAQPIRHTGPVQPAQHGHPVPHLVSHPVPHDVRHHIRDVRDTQDHVREHVRHRGQDRQHAQHGAGERHAGASLCHRVPGEPGGHSVHADQSCSSAAVSAAVSLPGLTPSVGEVPAAGHAPARGAHGPPGGRAPPTLAELQLLRI